MKKSMCLAVAAGLASSGVALAQQNYAMVVNSNSPGGLMLFDPANGALVNASFIADIGPAWTMQTPKAPLQVGNEIWVTDQIADVIFRFDLNGKYYSRIGGELNNMRGLGLFNGHVFVTSADAIGGTPAHSIVKFDMAGNRVMSWVAGNSPFDVLAHNGELLISHFTTAVPDITRWDENGAPLGTFHMGAINLPQQLAHKSNNNVLAAGFSTTSGVFEYDPTGAQVASFVAAGPRGVFELGNGNIMWTHGTAVNIYDIVAGTSSAAALAGGQYINLLTINASAVGACCMADGSCQTLEIAACGAANGVFRGDAVACGSAACIQPGACCFNDGTCTQLQNDYCTGAGGVFHGVGVACGTVVCPTFLPTPNPSGTSTTAGSGIFFDLTAATGLTIPRIDFFPNAAAGAAVTADVYIRTGSYVGHDTAPGDWPIHHTIVTTSVGGTTTPTVLLLPQSIAMAANDVVGVYVVGTVGGIRYRASTSPNPVGNIHLSLASNDFRSALFGGTLTAGRRFAGVVHYTLAGAACYPNCDGSTVDPCLNVQDFGCFLNQFAAGNTNANCDASTIDPILNVQDFGCFLNLFAAGCSGC